MSAGWQKYSWRTEIRQVKGEGGSEGPSVGRWEAEGT